MVTHEDDIAAWAKRVIRMRDGLIIDDSPNQHRKSGKAKQNGAAPVDPVGGHWEADFNPNDPEFGQPNEELTH
jgi:hypothetical protein